MIAQDSRQRAEGGIRHPWPSLRVQMMRKWERKSSVHLKITLNWITYTLVYNYMDRASTRLLRLSVCRYRQQRNIPVPTLSLSVEKVSFINVFQHVEEPLTFDLDLVSTCFCGKNNWSCTDHSSFTDCNQTQFCCHHSEFSPFCLLNITRRDKGSCLAGASTCFRTQGTEYDLHQVTKNAQFQSVLGTGDCITGETFTGKKNSICGSSGGSDEYMCIQFWNMPHRTWHYFWIVTHKAWEC